MAKFDIGETVFCTDWDDPTPLTIYAFDASLMGHPEVLYFVQWDGMTPEQDDWNPFLESQLVGTEREWAEHQGFITWDDDPADYGPLDSDPYDRDVLDPTEPPQMRG